MSDPLINEVMISFLSLVFVSPSTRLGPRLSDQNHSIQTIADHLTDAISDCLPLTPVWASANN